MSRIRIEIAGVIIVSVSALVGLSICVANDPPTKATTLSSPVSPRAFVFSPDGKLLIVGYGGKDQPGGVAAWEVSTWKRIWHHPEPMGVRSISFAPDGQSLAVAHGTSTALRLAADTGKSLGEIGPHPAEVRAISFIAGTDFLATASDGSIRLWEVANGQVHKELLGHPKEVRSLIASSDGHWLVSTGPDTTRIWDLNAGEELKGVIPQDRRIAYYGITFVGPNRVLLGNNQSTQRIIELPAGKELLRFQNSGGYAGAAYSPATGLAAFRSNGGPQVSIADVTFRSPTSDEQSQIDKLLRDFDDDSYDVREAASAAMKRVGSVAEPALRRAATGGPSAELRMRAREARQTILDEPIRRLSGHTGDVGPMAFSPDGKLLVTGADDGTIRVWNPLTGEELACINVSGADSHR